MALAGIISGILVAVTYGLIADPPSIGSWLRYNSIFFIMFIMLSIVSILIFDPITSAAALIATNERPDELIKQAIPLTAIFTVSFAILLGKLYARTILQYSAILITCGILMIVLGLNVSILGLVFIPTELLYLILELFGLIFFIVAVNAVMFVLLEKKTLGESIDGRSTER